VERREVNKIIQVGFFEVSDTVRGKVEAVEGSSLSDGSRDFFHRHVGEPKFAKGGAGLDKVKGDFEHGVSGEFEGDDGVGVLVEDDGDGA
jgi:hypothetical protein